MPVQCQAQLFVFVQLYIVVYTVCTVIADCLIIEA